LREALWFSQNGHSVTIASPGDGELYRRSGAAGLATYPVAMRNSVHPPSLISLFSIIKERQISVIYSHSGKDSWLGGICGAVARVPLVRSRELFSRIKRKSAYYLPKRVLACSEGVKAHLVASGVDPAKVFVQYPPVDVEKFLNVPKEARMAVSHELGLEGIYPIIAHVGEFRGEKRQEDLIAALPSVVAEFPAALLLLVGRGKYSDLMKDRASALGVEGYVRFLGEREDVPAILANADIFAFPSDVEPFGMSPVEAMAAGVPVVVTGVGGLKEIVSDGVNGLHVPRRDPHALASTIIKLLKDPTLSRQFVEAGRERARFFDAETAMNRLLEHFRAVIG